MAATLSAMQLMINDGGGGSSDVKTTYRNQILGSLQGRFDALYAYTDLSTSYYASSISADEGHLMLHTAGKAYVTLSIPLHTPIQVGSGMFHHLANHYNPKYEALVLDVETQKNMLAAGIDHIGNIPIPKNPQVPLNTGGFRAGNGSITNTGIFAEGHGANDITTDNDRKYFVKTRVPDSVDYNYERQKYDDTIPFLEKMHAQYQRPMAISDRDFETELAKARYLSGMTPYLTNEEAKKFEHFTYWRYKNIPSADVFRGAYIHVFLTRPDLHLLDRNYNGADTIWRDDVLGNHELGSLIFINPEGALSLIQKWQTHAMTDINLFLSNRLCGISSVGTESIDEHKFVDNFTQINTVFGGRMDNQEGDIDLTFYETDDLSVSNTILLWMKYMHATYTGQLSALCNGDGSEIVSRQEHQHPLWRRLDSLASVYVVATDMTQRNIIFWRKYFGVFPKSAPFAGMTTENNHLAEGSRQVNVPFKYTTYRTNNILDLYAFNRLSDLTTTVVGANKYYYDDMFQVKDTNVIPDNHVIAGLPFIGIESHLTTSVDAYNRELPMKMIVPHLLFTQTDGAFMPNGDPNQMGAWVRKYWGGYGNLYAPYNSAYSHVENNNGIWTGKPFITGNHLN